MVEALGEGGMAAVFKAYDSSRERYVAIKVIRTELGAETEFLKRFHREAKALAQLDHPYILKVLDYGEEDRAPYLVMPFVPSETQKERMSTPWPYQEAARMLAPVARALDFAHHQNVIHRDVKPANILITQSGAPILSDFGIAKILETGEQTHLTGTGFGIGTPDYMAPEQWLGSTDARTVIYALGMVFYEIVTGRRPYVADTPAAVMFKHMQDPLSRPRNFVRNLPDKVEQVIFKAIAKKPKDRYQEMDAFATALEKLGESPAMPAGPGIPKQLEPPLCAPAACAPVFTKAPDAGQGNIKKWTIGGIAILAVTMAVLCMGVITVLVVARSPLFFPVKNTQVAQITPRKPLNATGTSPVPGANTTRPPPVLMIRLLV
jgi:serine/threonine protein kinase